MRLADLGDMLIPKRQKCPGQFVFGLFNGYRQHCRNGRLVLRFNRKEGTIFWGCSNWPQCRHALPFNVFEIPYKARIALLKESK